MSDKENLLGGVSELESIVYNLNSQVSILQSEVGLLKSNMISPYHRLFLADLCDGVTISHPMFEILIANILSRCMGKDINVAEFIKELHFEKHPEVYI